MKEGRLRRKKRKEKSGQFNLNYTHITKRLTYLGHRTAKKSNTQIILGTFLIVFASTKIRSIYIY
jgi:hypothetical protein